MKFKKKEGKEEEEEEEKKKDIHYFAQAITVPVSILCSFHFDQAITAVASK